MYAIFIFIQNIVFSEKVLIFHDGAHPDHIQLIENLLKKKQIPYSTSTNLFLNLNDYSIIILEYDYFRNSSYYWYEERIKDFLECGGKLLGFGDGGVFAVTKILNLPFSSSLYVGSLESEVMKNNSILFYNFSIGDSINLGKSALYNIGYTANLNESNYYAWLKIKENSWIILFSSKNLNIFGFSLGCGGWINTTNCELICSNIIDLLLSINKIKVISPSNKTYFSFSNYTQIPLDVVAIFPLNNFSIDIFVNDELLLSQNASEELRIKTSLNQTFGDYCIKVVVYLNETLNETVCYSIRKAEIYNKTLFVVDNDWKNIISISPFKVPVLVYDEKYKESIEWFIENYKPEKIFLLGNVEVENGTKIDYKDFLEFFENKKGIYADTFEKYVIASQIASLLKIPIVFSKENAIYDFSQNTTEEIEDFYISLAKEKNLTLNYLILTNSPYSTIISSVKDGFIIFVNTTNSSEAKNILKNKIQKLNSHGFLLNNSKNIVKGNYLLLFGVPYFEVDDPVEKQKFLGLINVADELDGDKIISDAIYADINNDNYLDLSFGRLPSDESLSSLIFSRIFLETNKNALIASEYLHQNFGIVLVYGGGGMLTGRNIAKILEERGYNANRLVERRTNHISFLQNLKPTQIAKFLITYEGLRKVLEKYASSFLSTIISNLFLTVKGLEFASEALMSYFEYDWSSFSQNYEDVLSYLAEKQTNNESLDITDVINILEILWPKPWPILNSSNLRICLQNSSIIFYEGLGNGSLWILPNNIEQNTNILDYEFWKQIISNYQYNGSNIFEPNDIPYLNSRIVWDNSDFSGIGKMKDEFLKKGAASFIGPSALSYHPFTGEFSSRFFKNGENIGKAFLYAYNSFASDLIFFDILNFNKPGIKQKTLLEFLVYGDPSLPKEGRLEEEKLIKYFDCSERCFLKVEMRPQIDYKNNSVEVNSTENIIEENEPIIPIKRFIYYLPENSTISEENIQVNFTEEKIENITIYRLQTISHSNTTLETNQTSTINKRYKIRINNTIDGRKEVEIVVPLLIFNETENSAVIVKNITISLDYETALDFSIETKNIKLGENATIKFKIFSKVKDRGKLYFEITNSSHILNNTYEFDLEDKSMEININFKPETSGKYKVTAVLEKLDPLIVGPREAYFEVYEEENNQEKYCEPKIRINEIMYNPKGNDKGREWIEIYNYGNCSVNLTNWYFSDKNGNHKIILKLGSEILYPNEYAIISNNFSKILEEYPNFNKTIFQASFNLNNENDTIAIKNSSKIVIDEVTYSKNMGGYDNGKSLELDEKSLIWRESYVDGGTPGLPNRNFNTQPLSFSEKEFTFIKPPESKNLTNITYSNENFEELEENLNETEEIEEEKEKITTSNNKTSKKEKVDSKTTGYFVLNEKILLPIILTLTFSTLLAYFLLSKGKFKKKKINKIIKIKEKTKSK
ncbi:MAG: lamin tail domain-containing protein [Candidatus Aenigmatarchaeota archaeon]